MDYAEVVLEMTTIETLVGIAILGAFFTMIFYLLFGQITVRKLRKNPATKHFLGVQFASGLDVMNVAQALTLPPFITNRLRRSNISYMYADSDLLKAHTNRLDRFLAKTLYIFINMTGFFTITIVILDAFGVFK